MAKRHEINFFERNHRKLQARAFPDRKWLLARFDPALDRAGPVQLYWATSWQRAEKRARQVDYVLSNVDQKRNL